MVNTPNKLLRAVAALSPFRRRGRESIESEQGGQV